ncbi:MAG: PilZ domain-containing protein [Nitrospira sp.]|nr:MAG: PilZ domain-containing protein [Nitrospira sp.]
MAGFGQGEPAAEKEKLSQMGKTLEYQGYTIQSSPQHLADGEKWQLRIFVSMDDHRGVKAREFLADGVYATEQEADIHGIAYGQRLIDGKVEGRSVMDLKTEDRRATPRLRVQFRTTFSASSILEGMGIMLDLSSGGCRIESPVTVEPGVSLELRIYAPNIEWPLMIEAASVQWVSGQTFGLAFFRITETERQRLEQVVSNLMEGLS